MFLRGAGRHSGPNWQFRLWLGLARARRGMATLEYAMLLSVLVISATAAWVGFAETLREVLSNVVSSFGDGITQ